MTTPIQLTRLSYNKEDTNKKLYLTESAQQDEDLSLYEISRNVVDTRRFSDPSEFHTAYEYTINVAHKMIPRVAESIKHYFSLCLSVDDLCRILLPFGIPFIQTAYDRYKSIVRCVTAIPGSLFLTSSPAYCVDKNIMNAMVSHTNDDNLNLSLYSDIIRYFSYNHIDKFYLENKIEFAASAGHAATRSRLQNVAARLCRLYGGLPQKEIHLAVGCYGISSENFYKALSSRILNSSTYIRLDGSQTASPWRKISLERYPADDDFESLLCNLIPRYVPTELCECLNDIVEATRQLSIQKKGVLATSVGQYADIPLMILAKIAKKPLAVIEHGGGELLKDSTPRDIDVAVCDRHFGFGTASNFYLPSPYLSTSIKCKKTTPPTLVANDSYRYISRLLPVFGNGTWRCYANQRLRFLMALKPEIRPIIRLYVSDSYSVADKMKQCISGLVFQTCKEVPIELVLSTSILLIHDHYSTTLHRTMALNRPSIIYSDAHIFTDRAMHVIESMRNVGIWHETPESAAAFYANLIATSSSSWDKAKKAVDDWWFSSDVQKVRELFCENYAMTSPDWAEHWKIAFDTLASEF